MVMAHEPDLEELLRDQDIMQPVMRSARVTADDLRRLSDFAKHARSQNAGCREAGCHEAGCHEDGREG